jgi:hypothetical protein
VTLSHEALCRATISRVSASSASFAWSATVSRAEPMKVQGKRPSPADFYLRISDAGRLALARENRRKWSVRMAVLFLLGLLAGVCVAAFLISRS